MDTRIKNIPEEIRKLYEILEWKHAVAVLRHDFPNEWDDILYVLGKFKLLRSSILQPGGGKSPISQSIDDMFFSRGWEEKKFKTSIHVDEETHDSPTHAVDYYKNKIAVETEWNNKDPFYDRDLNNFRLLHQLDVISVGIIITRADSLQDIFDLLGKGKSYGPSTTHMNKLIPKVEGGGAGGCPVLAIGITKKLYVED